VAEGADAIETFMLGGIGRDDYLNEARAWIYRKVCMIFGSDQLYFFTRRDVETAHANAQLCFREADARGRHIPVPSDRCSDTRSGLLRACADEGARCAY
jgi:hypothetical protein